MEYEDSRDSLIEVPDAIKTYLTQLRSAVVQGNINEIGTLYDVGFSKLIERYYKVSRCPAPYLVDSILDSELLFSLYKDLYYRHIYSILCFPTFQDRSDSFQNYLLLFNLLSKKKDTFELPSSWLFDMIHEFILQYQEFCQFRLSCSEHEELSLIIANPDVWSTTTVLKLLNRLASNAPKTSISSTSGMLSLYAIYGLLHINVLSGDYASAISVFDSLYNNLAMRNAIIKHSPSCISSFYYYGFSLFMMKQYDKSISLFIAALLHYNRFYNKSSNKTYLHDTCVELVNRLYCLLAMTLALAPQKIDEAIYRQLLEKVESFSALNSFEMRAFESIFSKACPTFIVPAIGMDDIIKSNLAHHYQSRLFLKEVKHRHLMNNTLSFLNLYSSIKIDKLIQLLKISGDDIYKLLLFLNEQNTDSNTKMNFFVDNDIVYIKHFVSNTQSSTTNFFIQNILKFEEMNKEIRKK